MCGHEFLQPGISHSKLHRLLVAGNNCVRCGSHLLPKPTGTNPVSVNSRTYVSPKKSKTPFLIRNGVHGLSDLKK